MSTGGQRAKDWLAGKPITFGAPVRRPRPWWSKAERCPECFGRLAGLVEVEGGACCPGCGCFWANEAEFYAVMTANAHAIAAHIERMRVEQRRLEQLRKGGHR